MPYEAVPENRPVESGIRLTRRRVIGGGAGLALSPLFATSDPLTFAAQTPEVATDGPDALLGLLACLPAPAAGSGFAWSYDDIAQQLDALDISLDASPSAGLEATFRSAMEPLASASHLFQHIGDEEFAAAIGFAPMHVHQVLTAGSWPTETLTLLRGGIDIDGLPEAWETSGYSQQSAGSGETIWSLGTDAEVDPENPIQSRMFAAFNNVTILDGDILAFGATLSQVEEMITAQQSGSVSALGSTEISPMLSTLPENTASLMAFDEPIMSYDAMIEMILVNPNVRSEDAESLTAEWEELFAESRQEVGSLPNYSGSLFGITSGLVRENLSATPVTDVKDPAEDDHVVIRLAAHSEKDAVQIAKVVEWRWNHWLSQRSMRPYADLMLLTLAISQGAVAVFNLEPIGNPANWMTLLLSHDILPFVVDGE